MFEVLVLIPLADNDGEAFPPVAFATFEAMLVARFGGFTRYEHIRGAWADAGRVYTDNHVGYTVVCRTIGQGSDVIAIVTFAKSHFSQEAVFIRFLGVVEIL